MKICTQNGRKNASVANLCKRYGNKTVLRNINCDFEAGFLFALLGENGAGKSTLASLLYGEKKADSGMIRFNNIKTCAIVHQRPLLADNLNVRDNIILGSEPVHPLPLIGRKQQKGGFIDFAAAKKKADAVLRTWNIDLDVEKRSSSLSAAERFYTAFASAVYKTPDILILDEPCAVLNEEQKKSFYPALKTFARNGAIVILITHDTCSALEYADRLVILRTGKQAVCMNTNDTNCTVRRIREILFDSSAVQGKPISLNSFAEDTKYFQTQLSVHNKYATPLLSVERVNCTPLEGAALRDISFKVFSRSITCIYGHRENGLETLENLITGMKNFEYTGKIVINKKTVKPAPRLLRKIGCGIVPFDRTFGGSNPSLSVEQIVSVYLKPEDKIKGADYARSLVSRAGIVIQPNEKASALSGGMLQRLIIEREIAEGEKMLILSEPERGLDSCAIEAMAKRLRSLAANGTAILLLLESGSKGLFYGDYCYSMRAGILYEI